MQTRTIGGSIALLAAAGMTLGSIGGEIIGSMFIHIAASVSAYPAGRPRGICRPECFP